MENELMKFDFQTQNQSEIAELLKIMEQLDNIKNDLSIMIDEALMDAMEQLDNLKDDLSELIKKHGGTEKKAESDLAVEKAYEMFVGKDTEKNKFYLGDNLEQECPVVDETVFDKEQTVDDFSILNIIPEQARKWVDRLTISEMIEAINNADKAEGYESEDEYVGELVDSLKDMAIAKYTNDILEGRITKIDDEEIRSEVVDYMKSKKMNIPETIEPKEISIDSIINILDKGEEIELEDSLLAKVFDKIWNSRDNIEIRIHNNKISLR